MSKDQMVSFLYEGKLLHVSNSLWGGPVCSDSDGEPIEIKGMVAEAYERAKTKLEGLMAKKTLIENGHAGVNGRGVIVDRRETPNSIPSPRRTT